MKNYLLDYWGDGKEYYRPTTARIISAIYYKGRESNEQQIQLEIEPGNLKEDGRILLLPSLTNIYGLNYSYPRLPIVYIGGDEWVGTN